MNPFTFSPSDTEFMKRALELAAQGHGRVSPNPLVGAIVVKDGQIIGKGYHEQYGGPHAEVHALDQAGENAAGADIYVTLEPCNHHGKTPPCAEKILSAGIRRVVSAMTDPNPTAAGGHDRLINAGLDVSWGLLEEEARDLNRHFLKFISARRPYVYLKTAATLDGQIATSTGDSKWITGPAARDEVHRIRHETDAILVGSGTLMADDPSLTARLPDGKGIDPIRIILDSRLRTPVTAQVLSGGSDKGTILVASEDAPFEREQELKKAGADIMRLPCRDGYPDLRVLMDRLGERRITSLLIEGGGRVLHSCLKDGIGDRMLLFLAPKLLGGDDGTHMIRGAGPTLMKDALNLMEMKTRFIGPDLLIEGAFAHPY